MACDNQSVSHDTASSSVIEDSLNISFENITYTVRHGLRGGRKTILKELSGSFNAGELAVIMGQSGAGKSTLLDILAAHTQPTSGNIYVNGSLRDDNMYRRRSCYIMQDDKVHDILTTQEALFIAAELKLGNHIKRDQLTRRVNEIISSLGLGRARNTRTGNLSGGQKKRLALGLELVSDPPIMFIDEPTSGLDSSISKQIIYLLHLLARQGRTLVVTMHQPSAIILQMVDKLYAVVDGQCAYMGGMPQLKPYFEQINLSCPPYHNPVDFLIEICVEHAEALVHHSDNGRNTQWISDKIIDIKTPISEDVFLTTLPIPKENHSKKILLKLKGTYATSFWKQFTTLTKRALLTVWRNPGPTLTMTGIHCTMGLFLGFLFFDIGDDATYFIENFNFLYFSLMFLMFTAFSAVSISFPEQLPIVRREHFNRWYSTEAYYASTLVSSLPTHMVYTLSYACITYWMTGQPPELIRFLSFCFVLVMVVNVALCLGLLNGSIFNVKNGAVFGPFVIMPFTIFSGFFLAYGDAPYAFRWMFHISFLKHGLVGLVISIFGMDRPKLPCSQIYCHYSYPSYFIQDRGMGHEKYYVMVVSLISICAVIIVWSYIILGVRLKKKW